MVFVLDYNNNSLSPTTNAKARRLLSSHKAFVFRLFPFVIKLKQSFNSTKSFSIKIDPGSYISGISIVDQDKALFFFESQQDAADQRGELPSGPAPRSFARWQSMHLIAEMHHTMQHAAT